MCDERVKPDPRSGPNNDLQTLQNAPHTNAGLVWAGASVRAVRALYEWLARLRAHQAALPPGQAPHHNSDRVFNEQLAPFLTGAAPVGHPLVRLHQLSQVCASRNIFLRVRAITHLRLRV